MYLPTLILVDKILKQKSKYFIFTKLIPRTKNAIIQTFGEYFKYVQIFFFCFP